MLDAGHAGYYNRSPCITSYYESVMAWKLQGFLKEELQRRGFSVGQTRYDINTDPALYDRGYKSKGYSLFLSLHSNAAGSGVYDSTDYVVTLCQVSGRGDTLAWALSRKVTEIMGTRQSPQILKKKNDYGGDWYGVLRGATAAGTLGVLIEHSFHTCTRATQFLLNDNNLRKLAVGEAETIYQYFHGGASSSAGTSSGSSSAPSTSGKLDVDGVLGQASITAWQRAMGTYVDGVISGQYSTCKQYHSNLVAVRYDGGGSSLVKAIQRKVGTDVDGSLGPATIKAIQRYVGTDADGYLGPATARAIQTSLNNNKW
jgi:N-acetylmuramoyl-L-alanine amidase